MNLTKIKLKVLQKRGSINVCLHYSINQNNYINTVIIYITEIIHSIKIIKNECNNI